MALVVTATETALTELMTPRSWDLAAFMVDRVGAANISTSRWPSAWMGTKHPIALGGSTLNRTRSTTCLTT